MELITPRWGLWILDVVYVGRCPTLMMKGFQPLRTKVLAAVNVQNLSGDRRSSEEVEGGVAEVGEGGAVGKEEGSGFFVGVGWRKDRAGGNGVDADVRGKFDSGS